MFYASASSNVWRYFSGRSYVCCHHLDPGVFSSLPPKVAIQQWKYYMQTFLKWFQEIFMFFRNFVLYQRIFCFFFSEPFISSSAAPPSPQLTMSPSVLTASLGEHSFVRKMCQVSINVWYVSLLDCSSMFPIMCKNWSPQQNTDDPQSPDYDRLTKKFVSDINIQQSIWQLSIWNAKAPCLLLLCPRGVRDIRGQCSRGLKSLSMSYFLLVITYNKLRSC